MFIKRVYDLSNFIFIRRFREENVASFYPILPSFEYINIKRHPEALREIGTDDNSHGKTTDVR